MVAPAGASCLASVAADTWQHICSYMDDWLVRVVGSVLRVGAVPRHLALIMDGNRRFARRRRQLQRAGHEAGFDALLRVMEWSFALGVKTLTVFAFSLENFRRGGEQVTELMALLEEKLEDLLKRLRSAEEGAEQCGDDVLGRYQVRVGVIGDLSMFPGGVRRSCAELTERTRLHSGPVVNICLGYTSTNEICRRMRMHAADEPSAAAAMRCERVGNADQDGMDAAVSRVFADGALPPVDLLIRTSGEERLSDFMLMEVQQAAVLLFLRPLWPELNLIHFTYAILEYQRQIRARSEQAHAGAGGARKTQ